MHTHTHVSRVHTHLSLSHTHTCVWVYIHIKHTTRRHTDQGARHPSSVGAFCPPLQVLTRLHNTSLYFCKRDLYFYRTALYFRKTALNTYKRALHMCIMGRHRLQMWTALLQLYKARLFFNNTGYRVAKTHRIPSLYRTFSAKEPYI